MDFELGVRKPSTGGDGVVENPVPPPSTNTCEDVQPPQSPYPCSQQKEWENVVETGWLVTAENLAASVAFSALNTFFRAYETLL